MPSGPDSGDGDGGGEAAGVGYAGASAGGDRTSSPDLHLPLLPRRDEGGVPAGGNRACSIRVPHQGGGGLSECAATGARGPRRRHHASLFGARRLCPASSVAWGEKTAKDLAPVAAQIADLVARAPVRNLDETGVRIGGKTRWRHTASTFALTHYRVSETRGSLLVSLQGGVIVQDHFKPYFTLKGVAHALCNAHHRRELKVLIEIEKEPRAAKMARLLRNATRAVRHGVEHGQSAVVERISRRIVAVYDEIVLRGLAFHEQQPALERRPGARGRPGVPDTIC